MPYAVLDDTADVDGDPVPGSNSTFQFVGASADQPELLMIRMYPCKCALQFVGASADQPELLMIRMYPCKCALCRQPESIRVGYAACPLMSQVGKWRQSTVH
jgi:hypothetical protein